MVLWVWDMSEQQAQAVTQGLYSCGVAFLKEGRHALFAVLSPGCFARLLVSRMPCLQVAQWTLG